VVFCDVTPCSVVDSTDTIVLAVWVRVVFLQDIKCIVTIRHFRVSVLWELVVRLLQELGVYHVQNVTRDTVATQWTLRLLLASLSSPAAMPRHWFPLPSLPCIIVCLMSAALRTATVVSAICRSTVLHHAHLCLLACGTR
jgi:hypothetical protein